MNKYASGLLHSLLCLLLVSTVAAQTSTTANNPSPQLSAADLAWIDLQAAAFTPDSSKQLPTDPAAIKLEIARHSARFVATADRAKDFYETYPRHAKVHQARTIEVTSLISAVRNGDATSEGRLADTVAALRKDKSVPAAQRAQAAGAYDFAVQMRKTKSREDRDATIERVARGLMAEFPTEPQGYESLLTLAHISPDLKARQLADELKNSPGPTAVKESATRFLGKLDLAGKPLAVELDGANARTTKDKLVVGRLTIIYTWASWSPGSLALAAELKKRNLPANLIGLNLDTDTAAAATLAQGESLPGELLYDERGMEGALAQRLKINTAPELFIVDAQGVIREVRGTAELDKKFKSFGL